MLMLMWFVVALFSKTDPAQAQEIHQPSPVITAAIGDNLTLHCFVPKEYDADLFVWFKQKVGHELFSVVQVRKERDPFYSGKLKPPKVIINTGKGSFNLTIMNVEKEDEAMYYCGLTAFYTVFGKGTFLSLKDNQEFKVSVFQNMLDLVPVGSSVNLQCSVFSESRTAELQVLWFRSAAPQPRPQIIYTHLNSSHQCKNSSSTYTCVYNFSKSILTLNDTGTYYCAVAMCGKIIFGNGTTVQVASLDPVVISLAVSLMVCVVVIIVQASFSCKRNLHKQVEGRPQQSYVLNQSPDALELNYAAVHLKRKAKRVREKGEQVTECVYSEVITSLND
ncbi:uncharacterized protein LOC134318693 [Trichomycterus rosablanca]|uniref:uncharacterized protein LOC134318693 n=1 Tax=Trichomycterus rosablanca TaxID=2290929 RepID=UPI002F357CD4